ncbi:MAG TPA: DUF1841 family protein [Paenalcaligenes sp.]|nr:DUF1841 family protein [Paenalcaligenes sp.]
MFSPSREQVRQFFIQTWKKQRNQQVLTPMEQMAADIISWHPEYHELLSQPDAIQQDFTIEKGQTNPFLHMSMHLAIQEQLSVDQPPGIRLAYQGLLKRCDEHEAQHRIMEALGEVVWEAQRLGTPLDNERYLELIRRHAT